MVERVLPILVVSLVLPLLLSLAVTPFVMRLAPRLGAMDKPNERKLHGHLMPRLGGVAIYGSFSISLLLLIVFNQDFVSAIQHDLRSDISLAASFALIVLAGVLDDVYSLSPKVKLSFQLSAGVLAYLGGVGISQVTHPSGGGALETGILSFPLTMLWIIGVTNAFNLIDGLDGLAAGVALISSLTISALALMTDGRGLEVAVVALVLAGATAGFLPYNFHPARIFLGDSGSMLLGFTLAVLSVQSSTKGTTAFEILVPVLALGLPIMDVMLSMTRRFLRSFLPKQGSPGSLLRKLGGMFKADRGHIHHQLVGRGLSQRKAALFLYVVSCVFGVVAFAVTVANGFVSSLILVAVAIAMVTGIRKLRYREMAILENGVLLPIYQWPVMNQAVFQGFIDLAFVGVAYLGAHAMVPELRLESQQQFVSEFIGILVLQMIVFSATGMYKTSFRTLGLQGALKIAKSVLLAVIVSNVAIRLVVDQPGHIDPILAVLDFYFLISLVLGLRVSFSILKLLSRKGEEGRKQVIIYGADSNSAAMLQRILQDENHEMKVLGILDDSPELEGKELNGYPIFGGHWKLKRILQEKKIDEILICSEYVKPEILRRLRTISMEQKVPIKRPIIQIEEFSPGAGVTRFRRPAISFALESTPPALGFDLPRSNQ